jgi:hypothetical protein
MNDAVKLMDGVVAPDGVLLSASVLPQLAVKTYQAHSAEFCKNQYPSLNLFQVAK